MKFIETGIQRSDAKRKVLVMVDDADYDFLNQYKWQASKDKNVSRHSTGHRLIHRLILDAPPYLEVDHIDGNRLNNQRSNLRLATSSQNKMNRGPRKDNKSGFKGVSWHNQLNKWTARIKTTGSYKHLGVFENLEDAAYAYNEAAKQYFGEFAWTNKI